MPRVITDNEKIILRSKGQWSELKLAVFLPHVIYSARLAGVPDTTDQVAEITFTSGSGTLADVRQDMTLYIGTTAGAYDLGMVRIRKIPIAGTFYIGEQSKVDWQTSCFLTVVDDFDLKAKHIRIDGTTPKMDYDIAYLDQHANFNPVPILGPVVSVAKLSGGEYPSVQIQLGPEAGYESYVFGSTIASLSWDIPGAVDIDDDTIARPLVTFDSPGWYPAYCIVTANNGKSKTGVRYVYIWDDDQPPSNVFQLRDWNEEYESGGINFNIVMAGQAGLAEIRDRALCVLFSIDHYDSYAGRSDESLGPVTGRGNIKSIGRIVGESIHFTPETSEVSFDVYGYQEWFKRINAFPIGIEMTSSTPNAWTNMQALTVDRALWQLFEWRSTATTMMDVILTGDNRYAKELMSISGDLWSQVEEIAFSTILAGRGVDQYGRLFVTVDPQIIPAAERAASIVTTMELEKVDLEGGTEFDRNIVADVGTIALSGVAVDINGHALSYFSLAPGHVAGDYGDVEVIDLLLLEDQARANQKAGLIIGWRNNPYPKMSLKLAQNNNFISCIPPQYIGITILESDTVREVELSSIHVIPRRRQMTYDVEGGILKYELEVEAESFEVISVDGDIPGSGDTTLPPVPPLPPLPPFVVITPGDITGTTVPKRVLIHDRNYGFIYTSNFDSDNPSWIGVNSGLTPNQANLATFAFVCPNGAFYVGNTKIVDSSNYSVADANGDAFIARAPAIGEPFVVLYKESTIRPGGDPSGRTWGLWAAGYNPLVAEQVAFIKGETGVDKKIYVGANGSYTAGAVVYGANVLRGTLSYGAGFWLFTTSLHFEKISPSGASVVGSGSPNIGIIDAFEFYNSHYRAGTSGITLHVDSTSGKLRVGADNLASSVEMSDADVHVTNGVAVDATGLLIMLRYGLGLRGKSSDGGVTWSTMGSLPFTTEYVFAWAGGAGATSRWIAAYSVIRYSPDFGTTWLNREGNITSIAPIPLINMIKVIG